MKGEGREKIQENTDYVLSAKGKSSASSLRAQESWKGMCIVLERLKVGASEKGRGR